MRMMHQKIVLNTEQNKTFCSQKAHCDKDTNSLYFITAKFFLCLTNAAAQRSLINLSNSLWVFFNEAFENKSF